MARRRAISASVEDQLVRFYRGKKCVVSGVPADWHHLDENPANSVFENLIPLDHSRNSTLGGLDRTQSQPVFMFAADLMPEPLLSQASIHYHNWSIAAAYGCARLAAFVGKKYAGATREELAIYSSHCLWYSRHLSEQRLFRDVLFRNIVPIVEANAVPPLTGITICHECASLLSEFGEPHEAEAILMRLDDMLPHWKQFVAQFPYRYSGLVRRDAIIQIGVAGDPDLVQGKLRESEEAAPHNLAVQVGAANARAWSCYLRDDYHGARDALQPFIGPCLDKMLAGTVEPKPIAVPLAMAAELLLIEYAARSATDDPFGDRPGRALLEALFGLSRLAKFAVPLVSPSMAQSLALQSAMEEFKARQYGDWTRDALATATLDAIRRTVRAVRV